MTSMSCHDVLARYSDYLDGLLPAPEAERVSAHIAGCQSCRRYDNVVRRGTKLFTDQTEFLPDPDFLPSLQHRLSFEDERLRLQPVTVGASAAVSVAAVVALAVWMPVALLSRNANQPDQIAISAPVAEEISELVNGKPDVSLTHNNVDVSLIDRGYTPLILEPPTAPPAYVRLTSYEIH